MKSMRDLLAIVDQNRQNLNENIQTAPKPGVPQLSYSEFDPEPAVDPDDPSLTLPDRFHDGLDSIDVPVDFNNNEDGDVLKEQGVGQVSVPNADQIRQSADHVGRAMLQRWQKEQEAARRINDTDTWQMKNQPSKNPPNDTDTWQMKNQPSKNPPNDTDTWQMTNQPSKNPPNDTDTWQMTNKSGWGKVQEGVAEAKSPQGFIAQLTKSDPSILNSEKESPYYTAGQMLDRYADRIGQDHIDFADFKRHAALLMGSPEDNMRSAKQVRSLDTAARDVILEMIWQHSATQKDADTYYRISGFNRLSEGTKMKTAKGLAETQAKHGDGKELYVGIEAYGIKGMKSTPWRKRFKSQAAFEKWLDNTADDVEVLGTREVNLNDSLTKEGVAETSDYIRRRNREEAIISGQKPARKKVPAQTSDYAKRREQEKKQGVAEGGPFSYGAKKPRKGSVAHNAELERKKRERNQPPIEPKDQMVGTAKVTKDVKEGVVPDHWPANWRDNWEKRDRWPQREIENAIKQYNEIAQQPMVQYEITPKMSDELRAAKLSIQRDKYYGGVAFAEIILRQNIDHDTIGNPSSWGIPFLQGFYDVVKTMDNPLRTIIRRALIDKKQHWEGEDVGQEKSWPSRVGPGKQGVAEGFAGEKVGQKPGDQVRGTEKAKSSKTRHPFQGRLVGGAMESQTYYIKHRGTGEIFESFDNLARAQRRYSQLGELQADYRLTKKR